MASYRIDERADPKLRVKLNRYLEQGGNPQVLPKTLLRHFEPLVGNTTFFSLREREVGHDRIGKRTFNDPEREAPKDGMLLRSKFEFEIQATQVRGMLTKISNLLYGDIRVGGMSGAMMALRRIFDRYPNYDITLELGTYDRTMNGISLSSDLIVRVYKKKNILEKVFVITDTSVVVNKSDHAFHHTLHSEFTC